ncbi:MAG: transglycosylase domain-containing protein, partial [Cytophagales bacterium]|nr:transglycosylase domain-containing protein [Cytophagales bacterium]
TFFNTTPDSLSIDQAALLVGLLKAPSRYNPVKHPDNALKRRNLVIGQLHKYNFLTQEEYDSIRQLPLALVYKVENHTIGLATYFRSAIRDFLLKWTKDNGYDLFEDGLRIYTTIDSRMQQHAEEAVEEHMKELQKKFEQHWEGQNPWINEKGVEIKDFIKTTSENIEIYKNLVKEYGEGHDSVAIMMNTPEPMKLFSWEGEVDTVVSPIDSIKYNKRFLHAGFMAMDPHTGYVKAWVGGINYKFFKYDHVMQGKRQVGSAFKPIVYAAALDNGYTPCDEVVDAPVTFRMPGNPPIWTPKNASGRYTGQKMTLRQAMSRSVNSITAYLMKQLGPQRVVDYARKLGIMGPMEPVPALCLGASDVSVYELVGAYSTFVNDGVWTKPFYITRIEDREGNILQEFVPRKKEAISEETAYLMIHMLKGATEEEGGTARGLSKELREDNEIGGKTGTTSNHSDGWFVGITRDLTAGAWVGGEERCIHFRTLAEGQGARTARPIWEKFMLKIYEDPALPYEKAPFQKPSKPISVELDCDKPKEDSEKKDDNSLEQEVDSVEKKPDFQLDENEIF